MYELNQSKPMKRELIVDREYYNLVTDAIDDALDYDDRRTLKIRRINIFNYKNPRWTMKLRCNDDTWVKLYMGIILRLNKTVMKNDKRIYITKEELK